MGTDTRHLTSQARTLRALADDLRAHSDRLERDVDALTLPARSGAAARTQVHVIATGCRTGAGQVRSLAGLVIKHADAVAQVERTVQSIERSCGELLRRSLALVRGVEEVTAVVPHTGVDPWMTILGTVAGGAQVSVRFFRSNGLVVDPKKVEHARRVAASISAVPAPGALTWLTVPRLLAGMMR